LKYTPPFGVALPHLKRITRTVTRGGCGILSQVAAASALDRGPLERDDLLTLGLQLRHKWGASGILELIRIRREFSVTAISIFSTQ